MISWPGANMHILNTAGVFLLKVNFEYDRRNCGICSKLTVKTVERSQLTPFNYNEKQPPDVFDKRAVLKNFAVFTGKHLRWSLFKNCKILGLQLC